jgi:hypothetical protein
VRAITPAHLRFITVIRRAAVSLAAVRRPRPAAALACAAVAAVAGCSSGPGHRAAPAPPSPAVVAVRQAGATAMTFSTMTGTMSAWTAPTLWVTGIAADPGQGAHAPNIALTSQFTQRLGPAQAVRMDFTSYRENNQPMTGRQSQILTASTEYLYQDQLPRSAPYTARWGTETMTQADLQQGGHNGQLMATGSATGPIANIQQLAGATSARIAGRGLIGGRVATEYTGTVDLYRWARQLPARAAALNLQLLQAQGVRMATYTVWIDAGHVTRRLIIGEGGTGFSQSVTLAIATVNRPVDLGIPPASRTVAVTTGQGGAS